MGSKSPVACLRLGALNLQPYKNIPNTVILSPEKRPGWHPVGMRLYSRAGRRR